MVVRTLVHHDRGLSQRMARFGIAHGGRSLVQGTASLDRRDDLSCSEHPLQDLKVREVEPGTNEAQHLRPAIPGAEGRFHGARLQLNQASRSRRASFCGYSTLPVGACRLPM